MKIFVSTGEASGDLHLSYLARVIRQKYPDCELLGVAGEKSAAEGVKLIQDIRELAIMGFWEALKKYSFLKEKVEEYLSLIEKEKIEKVLLVDYGGFHLKFLKLLKQRVPQVKVYYYIPPKLWVWGKKRIKTLALADEIMVIFPWEYDFYKKENLEVTYFGNPFSEIYLKREREGDAILLLAGSRKQEILSLSHIYLNFIQKNPEKRFLWKLAHEKDKELLPKIYQELPNLELVVDKSLKDLVSEAAIAVAVSGTVTLELALLGLPTIVVYKTSFLNYAIAKYILKVGYIALPNITLGKEVFPELVQEKCNLEEITVELKDSLEKKEEIEKDLDALREKLSGEKVIEHYADFLIRGKNE